MKKFLNLIVTSALVLAFCITSINPAIGDAWVATGAGSPSGTMIAAITESADYSGVSRRINHVSNPDGTFDEFLCAEGAEPKGPCAVDTQYDHLHAEQVLPVCKSDTQTDCVEGFKYGTVETSLENAKLVKELEGQTYPELSGPGGLPAAGTISIWDAPGLPNAAGTTKYAVQVNEVYGTNSSRTGYEVSELTASIIPISEKSGSNYRTAKLTSFQDSNSGHNRIGGWEFIYGCAATENNYCAVTEDFAPKSRFVLNVRASNKITGWFKGRIQKPTVSIEKFSETNNRFSLQAEPVSVPRLAALVTPDNTSASGKTLLERSMRTGAAELFKGETLRNIHPDTHDSIAWVEEFRNAAKDTAAAISTLWNFGTLPNMTIRNSCFEDKTRVVGVVTTNATALSVGEPEFKNGMLEYKVAGLHYAPDGRALNEGSYDLVMRSDVARCLYGFTSAPISAKISVVSDSGENKFATTVISEKDGWIKIAAYGFTYSSPTISVKLTQAKAATKTTITCVKGKLTKKITAVSPKCPAGYKKK